MCVSVREGAREREGERDRQTETGKQTEDALNHISLKGKNEGNT